MAIDMTNFKNLAKLNFPPTYPLLISDVKYLYLYIWILENETFG